MGYAVQVDPAALAASATRLVGAADTIAAATDRLVVACGAAAAASGDGALAAALERGARSAAVGVGQVAELVRAVATATGASADDYRVLEQILTGRWGGGASADGTRP